MTREQLIALCRGWDGSDSAFAAIVSGYLDLTHNPRHLADEMEAAVSTVYRWAQGFARPMKGMKVVVVRYILQLAESAAS